MSTALKDVPLALHVRPLGSARDQFSIDSDYMRAPVGEWEDVYVSFSGFFGQYGPALFAVAPELASALADVLKWHGKRDANDNLLPAHEQTREIARGMRLIERIESEKGGAS